MTISAPTVRLYAISRAQKNLQLAGELHVKKTCWRVVCKKKKTIGNTIPNYVNFRGCHQLFLIEVAGEGAFSLHRVLSNIALHPASLFLGSEKIKKEFLM